MLIAFLKIKFKNVFSCCKYISLSNFLGILHMKVENVSLLLHLILRKTLVAVLFTLFLPSDILARFRIESDYNDKAYKEVMGQPVKSVFREEDNLFVEDEDNVAPKVKVERQVKQQVPVGMDYFITTTDKFISSLKDVQTIVLEGEKDDASKAKFEAGFKKQKLEFDQTIKNVKTIGDEAFEKVNKKVLTFETMVDLYKRVCVFLNKLGVEKGLAEEILKQKRANLVFQIYGKIAKAVDLESLKQSFSDASCLSLAESVLAEAADNLPEQNAKESSDKKGSSNSGELEKLLKEKMQKILDLENAAAVYMAKIKSLNLAKEELEKLKVSFTAEEAKIRKLQEESSQNQIERDSLREQLFKKDLDLKKKDLMLTTELDTLKKALAGANNKLQDMYNEKLNMQILVNQGQQEVATVKQDLVQARSKIGLAEDKAASFEQSLKRAQEEAMTAKARQNDLVQSVQSLTQKVQVAESSLEEKSKTNRSLEDSLKSKTSLYDQLRLEHQILQEKAAYYKRDLETANNTIQTLQSKLQGLNQSIVELQSKIDQLVKEQSNLKKQLADSSDEKRLASQEVSRLKQMLRSKQTLLMQKEQAIKKINLKRDQLKLKTEQLKDRIPTSAELDAKYNLETAKLNKNLAEMDQKLNKVTSDLNNALVDKKALEKSIQDLKSESDQKQKTLDELKQSHVGLQDKLTGLDKSLKINEDLLSKSEKEKKAIEVKLVESKTSVDEKQKELSTVEAKGVVVKESLDKSKNIQPVATPLNTEKKKLVLPVVDDKAHMNVLQSPFTAGVNKSEPEVKQNKPPLPKSALLVAPVLANT